MSGNFRIVLGSADEADNGWIGTTAITKNKSVVPEAPTTVHPGLP